MSDRLVRFLRNELPYMHGETAGFPAKAAGKLVKRGSAEYADGKDAPAQEHPAHEPDTLPLSGITKDKLKRVDPITVAKD
ncbi:hypothetical protein [Methylovirgula sp. 4M-Z18]|uniref:hypothetical protein n=1 Tax=Methylovirgula sp. 4M-Z18 TaxID=2293567 RepID=UPI000E2F14D7|nr:hypothetical protein [Methylovirgula sp. 4M-Z18]